MKYAFACVIGIVAPLVCNASSASLRVLDTPPRVQLVAQFDEPINAISATISFDPATTVFQGWSAEAGAIRLWVVPPAEVRPGVVHAEGIIPGGVSSALERDIVLTTLLFQSMGTQQGNITWTALEALTHTDPPRSLLIPFARRTVQFISASPVPMEEFMPRDIAVVQLPTEHGEEWFLQYVREGNGSPVRLRERWLGLWWGASREISSPELLADQWRLSILEVSSVGSLQRIVPHRLILCWAFLFCSVALGYYLWMFRKQ